MALVSANVLVSYFDVLSVFSEGLPDCVSCNHPPFYVRSREYTVLPSSLQQVLHGLIFIWKVKRKGRKCVVFLKRVHPL